MSEAPSLDATIKSFADLDALQLRLQWRNHLGGSAPAHLPRWLLMRILAHRIQAKTLGELDKATLRIIRAPNGDGGDDDGGRLFAPRDPATRDGIRLKAGALLVREWNGRLERVMVLEKGFAWNGKSYGSLSQIAKAMTGTSWNGHRFFGLRPGGPRTGGRTSRRLMRETSVMPVSGLPESDCAVRIAGPVAEPERAETRTPESPVVTRDDLQGDPTPVPS
ncbi:MAG: DUF2924 domain-containing protein [Roseiarcus sp.]